jgi:hypothetical protein
MKAIIQLLLVAITSLVMLPLHAQVNCAAKFSKNFKMQNNLSIKKICDKEVFTL